jgi:hypothetical protein
LDAQRRERSFQRRELQAAVGESGESSCQSEEKAIAHEN